MEGKGRLCYVCVNSSGGLCSHVCVNSSPNGHSCWILDKNGNGTLSAAEIDEFYDTHLDRALEETLDGVVHQTVPQTSVRYSGSESGEA